MYDKIQVKKKNKRQFFAKENSPEIKHSKIEKYFTFFLNNN